jgi:hypothetical protein
MEGQIPISTYAEYRLPLSRKSPHRLTLLVAPGLAHPVQSTAYPLASVRSLSVFDI